MARGHNILTVDSVALIGRLVILPCRYSTTTAFISVFSLGVKFLLEQLTRVTDQITGPPYCGKWYLVQYLVQFPRGVIKGTASVKGETCP